MFHHKKSVLLSLGLALCSGQSMAHGTDPNEMALENRQAVMTLVGQNFGPMAAMIKGEIPWDSAAFAGYASDLEKVTSLNIMRGFIDGSQVGKTKAKPDIWKNKADFEKKMQALTDASAKLAATAGSSDKKAIVAAFKDTGGACKSCHDDYKSKDYLN